MSSRKSTNESASSSSRSNRSASADLNTSDDKLFEPSLEMMVNDFDDESTLELEEKMASTEAQDPNAELNSLQKVRKRFHSMMQFDLFFIASSYFLQISLFFLLFLLCAGRRYAN